VQHRLGPKCAKDPRAWRAKIAAEFATIDGAVMPWKEQRSSVFWRALGNVALDRTNVGVWAALSVGGLALHSTTFLALATGGYLSALAADLTRPETWQCAAGELRAQPPTLPEGSTFDTAAARELLGRLERSRSERWAFVRHHARGRIQGQTALAEGVAAVEGMVLRGLTALDRATFYVANHPLILLRKEQGRLAALARDAANPDARVEYSRAAVLATSRLRAVEQIDERRLVIQAKLEAMVGYLEMLPLQMMKMDVLDSSAALLTEDSGVARLAEELESMEDAANVLSPAV
jgi:hypothetical protein